MFPKHRQIIDLNLPIAGRCTSNIQTVHVYKWTNMLNTSDIYHSKINNMLNNTSLNIRAYFFFHTNTTFILWNAKTTQEHQGISRGEWRKNVHFEVVCPTVEFKTWRVERARRMTRGSARAKRLTSALSRRSKPKHRPGPHPARDWHRIQLACREHRSRHRSHHRKNMKNNSKTTGPKPHLLHPSAHGCPKDAF